MAFLSGWSYRKKVTVTGQTGAGTNYQVKLLVGESAGSSGANFHVVAHSASFPSAKNISGDLRFTASDGTTLLDFWVQDVSGSGPNRTATIWVEISADLGTNQDIYCYYGGTTTNVSNGANTFVFFDDFDQSIGSTPNATRWNYAYTVTERGDSTIRIGGTGGQYNSLASVPTFGEGYSCLSRSYVMSTSVGTSSAGCFTGTNGFNGMGYSSHWNSPYYRYDDNTTSYTVGYQDQAYHIFEVKRKGGGASQFLVDGTSIQSATGSGTGACNVGAVAYQSDYNYIDWIAVKKCQTTEPVYNTVASEEVPNVDITVSPAVKTATFSIPSYSTIISFTLIPTVKTAMFSLPSYTIVVIANPTILPSVKTATFSIPAYIITATQFITVTPTVKTSTFSIPSYTITAIQNPTITPSVKTATFSVPAYSILIGDTMAQPNVVTTTFSIPSYTITTTRFITVTPTVNTVTFSIPSYQEKIDQTTIANVQNLVISIPFYNPSATQNVTISPSVQTLTFTVPSYALQIGSLVTPQVLSIAFNVPTYVITTTRFITIARDVITFLFSIPQYTVRGDIWQEKYPSSSVSSFQDKSYNGSNNWSDKPLVGGDNWQDKF